MKKSVLGASHFLNLCATAQPGRFSAKICVPSHKSYRGTAPINFSITAPDLGNKFAPQSHTGISKKILLHNFLNEFVSCLTSPVSCFQSHVSCLMSPVSSLPCLTSPI